MSLSLTEVVSSAFSSLKGAVDNAVRSVVYRKVTTGAYNPTTGAQTDTVVNYTVDAVFTSFRRNEKEKDFQNSRRVSVEAGDQKVIIPAAQLPVEPSLEDLVIDGSKQWRVVDYSSDPTGQALYTLQVRIR